MAVTIEGNRSVSNATFAIVVSRFNQNITERLLEGALETFNQCGVPAENLKVVWVPGAFEIPVTAQILAAKQNYAAICCLGAVIQGETTHHEYINQTVAHQLMHVSLDYNLPVIFGILTCQNMQLALDRAGGKVGNKGSEAALTAIQMVSLFEKITRLE